MQTGAMQNETGGTAAHAGVLGAEDVAEDCPEGGAGTGGTACAGVLGARRMATILRPNLHNLHCRRLHLTVLEEG